jgi:D-3-phosphoglycerate dehydrogenase
MLLRADRPVDAGVLEPIGAAVGAHTVRSISLI